MLQQLTPLRARIALALAFAVVIAFVVGLSNAIPATAAVPASIFGSTVPATAGYPDTARVELGVQFTSTVSGTVAGVRFYKGAGNTGTHTASLWKGSVKVASGTFTNETSSGWQQMSFATPVSVAAGVTYTASYLAPNGRYALNSPFAFPFVSGKLTAIKGVYRYGGGYPTGTYQASNYWVDVAFAPTVSSPTPSPTTVAPTTVAPTTVAPTTVAPTTVPPTTSLPAGVTLRQPDGGADWYQKWPKPIGRDTFPLAVWAAVTEYQAQINQDKAMGLNSYFELYGNSSDALIQSNGMFTFHGSKTANGFMPTDEADMWAGPGSDPWTGVTGWNTCIPIQDQGGKCGYTVMETLNKNAAPGQMKVTNYGKGVIFWNTDAQAKRFLDLTDVASADIYWFTDIGACVASQGGWWYGPKNGTRDLTAAECRMASHYGDTTDRVRKLAGYTKPVWGFVELGQPFSDSNQPNVNAAQINAAVWSNIIHGARGITYFNHNFGGSCISQNILRDACGNAIRPGVTATNAQVTRLAPVINSPFVDGLVTTTGVDVAAKKYGADIYLFTQSDRQGSQVATFSLACGGGTVEVIDEARSLSVTGRSFTDTFADSNAVHLYRIPGGATACGM